MSLVHGPPGYRPNVGLRYLFIDFNAYFAAVEQHDHPGLFGRPVVVAPLASESSGAIAVSYEARAFGIRRGTPIREARRLCPGLAVMPARHDRYVAVHKQLMDEIGRHLPLVKVYSIDEAAFRLSRSEEHPRAALVVARAIKRGIAENVGPALRASIGLAPSRLLAKLAAERNKPDGLTVLEIADLPRRLAGMPLEEIPGVGPGVAARLARAGVHDFPALWRLQPKQARAIWGSVQGERFWYALHGYEVDEPETKKSMIGHSRVLSREHERPCEARVVGRALLLKAASRLRHYGLHARALTLAVRLRPVGRWEGARRFPPTQDSFSFLRVFDALWAAFLDEARCGRGAPAPRCGGVTVYLHDLAAEGAAELAQLDLFAPSDPAADRRARLWATIDRINADLEHKFERLGGGSKTGEKRRRYVTLARQQGLDLDYLGAKIAFSRVPEEAEFLY
ncbi:Y-family DNA polymerase [Amphiplicatus metriothermophilus]|nr:hypothetical protein [Amphiplicatus metriothermophilus]MBB5519399.1 DNA polymerase-4 [Amphiplicatus metriothermophilus]